MRRRTLLRCPGFTSTELVALLAVTAVVGALGVSALRTYVVRQQVAAGLAAAASVQARVARAFRTSGAPPADWAETGFPIDPGELAAAYVAAIDIVHGRIEIRFGNDAHEAISDRILSLTPFETADRQVVWICGDRPPGVGLELLGFATGSARPAEAPHADAISTRYLPPHCR